MPHCPEFPPFSCSSVALAWRRGVAPFPQVAVSVERLFPHPKYQKIVKHRKKFMCHDHHEICGLGDRVQIKYVGRLSKRKFWSVIDMVHRHPQVEGEPFPMAHPPKAVEATPAPQETIKE